MGLRVDGFMGLKVYGFMGLRVDGLKGLRVGFFSGFGGDRAEPRALIIIGDSRFTI